MWKYTNHFDYDLGYMISTIEGKDICGADSQATAKLIVKAVNSFDLLVRRLHMCRGYFEAQVNCEGKGQEMLNDINEALKLAEATNG